MWNSPGFAESGALATQASLEGWTAVPRTRPPYPEQFQRETAAIRNRGDDLEGSDACVVAWGQSPGLRRRRRSGEAEHRRHDDHDHRSPQGEDREVARLPPFVTNRADSKAAPARLTRRTTLSPSAAVRFGLNPRSPIRATIEPSTITSSTSALATPTSWIRSNQFGVVDGSRADIA